MEEWVEGSLVWIHGKLLDKKAQARPASYKEYVCGEGFCYLGLSYRLSVVHGLENQATLRLFRSRFELRRDVVALFSVIRWSCFRLSRFIQDSPLEQLRLNLDN